MMLYLMEAPVASILFLITLATSLYAFSNEEIYRKFVLNPYEVARGHNVWTVITSGLIHADWNHLFFNMLSYYFFAFQLESVLGHWQFGVLYLVSLVLADLPSIQKHKDDSWYNTLGASGAISAVIFSAILFNPRGEMGLIFLPFTIPAWIFGILYLVYCHFASKHARNNVNHDAHLFGALSGILITIVLHHSVINDFVAQFK